MLGFNNKLLLEDKINVEPYLEDQGLSLMEGTERKTA